MSAFPAPAGAKPISRGPRPQTEPAKPSRARRRKTYQPQAAPALRVPPWLAQRSLCKHVSGAACKSRPFAQIRSTGTVAHSFRSFLVRARKEHRSPFSKREKPCFFIKSSSFSLSSKKSPFFYNFLLTFDPFHANMITEKGGPPCNQHGRPTECASTLPPDDRRPAHSISHFCGFGKGFFKNCCFFAYFILTFCSLHAKIML